MTGIEGVMQRIGAIVDRVTTGPPVGGPAGSFTAALEAAMDADAVRTASGAVAAAEAGEIEEGALPFRPVVGTYLTIGGAMGISGTEPVTAIVPSSGFVLPVVGMRTEGLWNSFGAPWGGHRHAGIDIFAPEGTPIVAPTAGTVEIADAAPIGGNRVWIRGDDGRGYYFAHLSAFAEGLEPGQHVEPGRVIGFVGHTGDAEGTPDHLHFAISVDNRKPGDSWDPAGAGWLDPGPFLGIAPAESYA